MKFIGVLVLCFAAASAQNCLEPDGLFADPRQCDRYISCKDGVAEEKLCPDGLVFGENYSNEAYPCTYQTEVDCSGRSQLQPAQPTENCGRSWGYFGSGNSAECGYFYNCVDKREFLFTCPEGLAFSSASYRCEWPDESPDCDAEAYLGFSCPAVRDESQIPLVGVPRYASQRDCRTYFHCVGQSPRLHKCDQGTVFNEAIHNCDEPENVSRCADYYPADELREIRRQKEERRIKEEERRQRVRERLAKLREQGGSRF